MTGVIWANGSDCRGAFLFHGCEGDFISVDRLEVGGIVTRGY